MNQPCTVKSCGRPINAGGLCRMHYQRQWRSDRVNENEQKDKRDTRGGIYQVIPGMTRGEMAAMRAATNMDPATFNYADPTPEMLGDPEWEAIWNEIKTWDVNVPTEYVGYTGATGNHVTAIYLAIRNARRVSCGKEPA